VPQSDHVAGRSRARSSLRRLWWLPLLLALVGGALGATYGASRPAQASATVLVNPLKGNPFSPTGTGEDLLNLESEAQLLASDRVAELAAGQLGFAGDPRALLDRLSVEVPPNTQLVGVHYSASRERTATDRAEAFAEAFLTVRTERAKRLQDQTRRIVTAQLAAANASQATLDRARATAGPSRRRQIDQQLAPIANRIKSLTGALDNLPVETSSPGNVVNRAKAVTTFGSVPAALVYGVAGFLVLLVVGLALALLLGRSGGRVRREDDVTSSGLTVLTSFTRRRAVRSRAGVLSAAGPEAQADVEEDMRRLRSAVLMRRSRPLPLTLLVATLSDRQPVALTGAGLAQSLAASNLRVALVDLGQESGQEPARGGARDRARDEQAVLAGPGLLEVLGRGAPVAQVVTSLPGGVDLVPVGTEGGQLEDLLVNPVLERTLAELASTHDVVVLAAGSLQSPAVQSVSDLVDGVVVEVWEGVSTRHDVEDLVQLEALGPRLNGVVYLSGSSRA
jgi:capsular polysaccharide biosynthesis protein